MIAHLQYLTFKYGDSANNRLSSPHFYYLSMVNPLTLNPLTPLTAVAGVQGNKKRELHLCNSQIFVVSPEPEFLNEYEWI